MRFADYLLLVLVFSTGCSITSTPSAPCPTDQQLLRIFSTQEAQFVVLAANAGDQTAQGVLGIERAIQRAEKPSRIWFPVWSHDFPGPGGCSKGFAYCEEAPDALVDDIDRSTTPGSPGNVEVYRAVKGNWYLFYQSSD